MKPNETVELQVGLSRRIVLPQTTGLDAGDKLLFRMISDTEFNVKVTKAGSDKVPVVQRKMRIYGLVLGHRKSDDKWLGLYLDQNGVRCAMQVSSSFNYLKGDLSRVGPKARIKLDQRFNKEWEYPVILDIDLTEDKTLPESFKQGVYEAMKDFNRGYFETGNDDLY